MHTLSLHDALPICMNIHPPENLMHSPEAPHRNHEQLKISPETVNHLDLKIVRPQELVRMKIPTTTFQRAEIMKRTDLTHARSK